MLSEDTTNPRSCPQCGEPPIIGTRFCRSCGFDLSEEEGAGEVERVLVLDVPETSVVKSSGCSCSGMLVVVAAIGVVAAIAIPNFHHTHCTSREKSCYANMRVLLGAIEMYNMDNAKMMESVDSDTMKRLKDGQYLKADLTPPEVNCSYSNDGNLAEAGRITCVNHGGVE